MLMVALGSIGLLSGCADRSEEAGGLPAGWERNGSHWWQTDADTSDAFREMADLQEMGIESKTVFAATRDLAQQETLARGQLEDAVKRSLIEMYRNEPEVVDSLFGAHAAPLLADADVRGDPTEVVERNKKKAYTVLRRHFQEPVTVLSLGEDIRVPYPDSLRESGVQGRVRMQVRLNEEGEPVAIELLEGVHPVLNEIAMRATTEMRWRPAYVLERRSWQPIPSWARFTIHFAVPGQDA